MEHNPSVFREMHSSQLAHFWSPAITAHVNGELTTLDFEHELAGLVISTEAARELYQSLGKQLAQVAEPAPVQDRTVKAKAEVKSFTGRPRRHWRAKPRAVRSAT